MRLGFKTEDNKKKTIPQKHKPLKLGFTTTPKAPPKPKVKRKRQKIIVHSRNLGFPTTPHRPLLARPVPLTLKPLPPLTPPTNCIFGTMKTPRNMVSIIILTYNTLNVTANCIKSVLKKTVHPFELFVVDNASRDGTVAWLKTKPYLTLIANTKNLGFSKGNNLAIRRARGRYVCLLNSDIIVRTRGWLKRMVKVARSSRRIGTVGCFQGTTRVQTKNGSKTIKQIKVGDLVLTHKNRFRKVKRLFRRIYEGKWIELILKSRHTRTIRATEEHPILVLRDNDVKWIKIKDILETDKLFVKSSKCQVCGNPTPSWKILCKHCNSAELNQKGGKLGTKYMSAHSFKGSITEKHFLKIQSEMENWKEKGYRAVPMDHIPQKVDFLAIKEDQIVGVEVADRRYMKKRKEQTKHFLENYVDKIVFRGKCLTPKIQTPLKGFVPIEIRKIREYQKNKITVYNLEVEEDESYTVNRCIVPVHNCKLLYPNGTLQHIGGGIHGKNPYHPYDRRSARIRAAYVTRNVPYNTGACLLITKAALKRVGLLDEYYPFGFEDVDYGLRVVEKGLRNVMCHEAVLTHLWAYTQRTTKKGITTGSLSRFHAKWDKKLSSLAKKVTLDWGAPFCV